MCLDASFYEQLQSHIGGLVRVKSTTYSDLIGKIGLLTAAWPASGHPREDAALVDLFIDGRLRSLYVYTYEVDFLDNRGER
jgi:hypothetical protein